MNNATNPLITISRLTYNQEKYVRESGIELLRIVAILMVLMIHANYWRIGVPTAADIANGCGAVFMRILLQMLSSPCVDVFIIISGYFAIKPKFRSVANMWFLLAFLSFVADIPCRWLEVGQVDVLMAVRHVVFLFWGWFIAAYLGLYLISPILNAFASNCGKRDFARFLALAFFLQFFFDMVYPRWSIFARTIFNGGYSVLSMAFLYLLGRFVRMHCDWLENIRARTWFYLYFALFTAWSVIQFLLLMWNPSGVLGQLVEYVVRRGPAYVNPVVIAGSLFLFLAFQALKFSCHIVNYVAGSALGVFCFHSLPFYEKFIRRTYDSYAGFSVLVLDAVFIMMVFLIGVAIDQCRILLWRLLTSRRG